MIREFNGCEFFAFLIDEALKQGKHGLLVIDRVEMYNRIYRIENQCPSIRISMDKYDLNTAEWHLQWRTPGVRSALNLKDPFKITIDLNHSVIPSFVAWLLPDEESVNKMKNC